MDNTLIEIYGNKVRVRACGLCWHDGRLLMVNHQLNQAGNFWAPPGGGIEYGETIAARLQKEFLEETSLNVTPGSFLFGCEFIRHPLHAIELFYDITFVSGSLQTGYDPEVQIIKEVKFMTPDEIAGIPAAELHGIFGLINSPADLKHLSGFYSI